MVGALENLGLSVARRLDQLGFATALVGECLYWLVMGPRYRQRTRVSSVVTEMHQIGIAALPITTLLAATIGIMLAVQGIYTMSINQEVDALRAMGINPVRYLVVPALVGMVIILPALTAWSGIVGLSAAGLFSALKLDLGFGAFMFNVASVLTPDDIFHGLFKSLIFAVVIVVIGVANGVQVQGGAAGVGQVTTRSVVQSIACIIIIDMVIGLMVSL
jgi:phospholipid/cholesterol/gamma-HCH transport system permease protein